MPRLIPRRTFPSAVVLLPLLIVISVVARVALPGKVLSLLEPTVSAASFTVTNTNNSGPGSFRQALIDANNQAGADTITFSLGAGAQAITLLTTVPDITGDLTITGPGSNLLTITRSTASGTPDFRIFTVSGGALNVNLSGLTISNGKAPDGASGSLFPSNQGGAGGGILQPAGSMTLTDVAIANNRSGNGGASFGNSTGGFGGFGGGISSTGTLTMTNCIVAGNTTGDGGTGSEGGTSGYGGGISFSGALTMTNSRVTANAVGKGGNSPNNTHGNGGLGGGIYADSGTLNLTNVIIDGNTIGDADYGGWGGGIYLGFHMSGATMKDCAVTNNSSGKGSSTRFGAQGGSGGGIANFSPLTMIGCVVSGNRTLGPSSSGGAMGGGIGNANTLIMIDCTVSGNQVDPSGARGGGIYNTANSLTLTNCTVTNNLGSSGNFEGGQGVMNKGVANVKNSIIANNGAADRPDVAGNFNSLGFNLIGKAINGSTGGNNGDQAGFTNGSNGDQVGTLAAPIDAKLGSLADNGGPTKTHALLSGSPAIDRADPSSTLTTDQRGGARPIDGDGNGSALVDIGAFEAGAGVLTVTKTADTNDSVCDADCSLREAIAAAGSNGLSANTIIFNIPVIDSGYNTTLSKYTITLTGSELNLSSNIPVTIYGPTGAGVIINGNNASRLFSISAGATVSIINLGLNNGNSGSAGGAIINSGTLTLLNDTVSSSTSTSTGGGIQNSGTLNVTNSTISGNSATQGGGIYSNSAGAVNIKNSTISGNSASQNGGGVFTTGTGPVQVKSSIIAVNTGTSSADIAGTVISQGYNIVKDTNGATITATTGDQFNVDPLVEMDTANPAKPLLKDNGGATQTINLRCSSPAIDKGINSITLATDQRGLARAFDDSTIPAATGGDNTDIGAFEKQAACTSTTLAVSVASGTFGGTVTLSARLSGAAQIDSLPGKNVGFTLNGVAIGSAITDSSGNATINNVTLAGINAGTYSPGLNSGITASFAGDTTFKQTTGSNTLTVNKATASVILGGLSQTYDGNPKSVTVTTSPAGLNTTVTYSGSQTAPANGGNYSISAVVNDSNYQGSAFGTLIISRANQTITFGALSNKTFGDVPFTASATASSGLPVTFSIASGPATISGNTVTITGSGIVTVRASQSGNTNYNAALSATQTFTVAAAPTSVALTSSLNPSEFNQSVTFTASVGSTQAGLGTPTGTVTFLIDGAGQAPVALASGNAAFTTSTLSSGTHSVSATYNGATNFAQSSATLSGGQVVTRQPVLLKLDQTSFTVSEKAGQVIINVLRSGDITVPVTVDYATADITAMEHSDYNRAAGTVAFEAGESSKAVNVLINQDSYQEGTEMLSFTLSNATAGATLSSPSGATVMINDDDTAPPTSNVIDDVQNFVRQQYHDFLNREPDPAGLIYWTGQITQCGQDLSCISSRRIAVSNAFFFEAEYQQTGSYVFRLYRAAYGNDQPFPNPDTSNTTEARKLPSYAVYTSDRSSVIGGASLTQSQLDLANLFVQRPEFVAKYPTSLDGPSFVDALLGNVQTDLNVDLTSQRSALVNLFNQGGRGAVLYRLADDNASNPINNRALIDAEYNRAFVITQYFGYLRRDPDIGGFLFWLDHVNRFPVRDTSIQNAMVCSFITSREYQERFSPVLTHSNNECPH